MSGSEHAEQMLTVLEVLEPTARDVERAALEAARQGTKGGGETSHKVSPAVTGRIAAALDVPIAALTDPQVFAAEYAKATRRPPRIPQPREAVA